VFQEDRLRLCLGSLGFAARAGGDGPAALWTSGRLAEPPGRPGGGRRARHEPFGVVAAQLLMVGVGVAIVVAAERLVAGPAGVRTGVRLLGAELLFVPLWAELAVHYAHLDDVLVLALTVAAVTALAAGRIRWVGPLLGAAIGAKPWAAAFLPLLWVIPARHRRAAVGWAVAVPVLAWLPFLLADPGTLLVSCAGSSLEKS